MEKEELETKVGQIIAFQENTYSSNFVCGKLLTVTNRVSNDDSKKVVIVIGSAFTISPNGSSICFSPVYTTDNIKSMYPIDVTFFKGMFEAIYANVTKQFQTIFGTDDKSDEEIDD